jgi:hypothetical protein
MSNSNPNTRIAAVANVSLADDMAAFDRLPPGIRRRIANAPINVDATSILQDYRANGAIRTIAAIDGAEPIIRERMRAEMTEACAR